MSLGSWVQFPPSELVHCNGTWSVVWNCLLSPRFGGHCWKMEKQSCIFQLVGYVYSHPILQDGVVWWVTGLCPVLHALEIIIWVYFYLSWASVLITLAEWSRFELVSPGSWVQFPPSELVQCNGTWSVVWNCLLSTRFGGHYWKMEKQSCTFQLVGYVYSHPNLQDGVVWWVTGLCPVLHALEIIIWVYFYLPWASILINEFITANIYLCK